MQVKKILIIGPESRLAIQLLNQLSDLDGFIVKTAGKSIGADFYIDLANLQQAAITINEHFDCAVVFGGMTRIVECEKAPELAMRINRDAAVNLMNVLNVRHWVMFSTNLVFSGEQPDVDKYTPHFPRCAYGRSKSEMEAQVLSGNKSVAIIRMTKVLQPNMALFDGFIRKLKLHQPVEVFHDMVISPVSGVDSTRFLISLLSNFKPGIYQLSGAGDHSYYHVIKYCAQKLRLDEDLIVAVSKNMNSPKYTSLKVDNIEKQYQFNAKAFSEVFDEYLLLSKWLSPDF